MAEALTKKDFKSDQDVRWCPGCGDYAVLNAVQSAFAELGMSRSKTVIVSGIGCSSRFPYYMSTYGFHTIHGRAPAVATGVKLGNPGLDVWVVTGDGDALSIGGNHLIHALRRNVNLKILLFNNRIYGLTKGQFSPTSEQGKVTKSTPMGSADAPFNPLALALGAGASFVARTVDKFAGHLKEVITEAAAHKGSAFVEIFQNCNIFNDGTFEDVVNKDVKDERIVELRSGKPLLYGKDMNKGLRWNGLGIESFAMGEGKGPDDCLTWDPSLRNPLLSYAMALMDPELPVPIGVLRKVQAVPFDTMIHDQLGVAREKKGEGDLRKLLYSGDIWDVK
jgi:2-oxoglutarate ferredoxin oxidoreductase subunit beta